MPLAHAIPGFLEYQPMSGYDLKKYLTSPSFISGLPRKAIFTRHLKIFRCRVLSKPKQSRKRANPTAGNTTSPAPAGQSCTNG